MEEKKMPSCGYLEKRYGGERRPRKLLALDGGGIRGVLTLQVLIRMEDLLREQSGQGEDFRLCNFFDYIAETSTGAMIAAGLARGMSARELSAFYMKTGPAMFDMSFILFRLRHLYESQPLANELKKTFGEHTNLFPESLKCLLLVVTRNISTDSPWPISSNPFARYNLAHRSSAPKEDAEVSSSGKSAFTNLANFPPALMYGAQVDQDINCRTVGRCLHGAPIDRELGDLIPRIEKDGTTKEIPLSENLGRQFLYALQRRAVSALAERPWPRRRRLREGREA